MTNRFIKPSMPIFRFNCSQLAELHFTDALLAEIRAAGIEVVFVTLHVGLASFTRVESASLDSMVVPTEYFSIESDVASRILRQKSLGKRVIAAHATTRALEW